MIRLNTKRDKGAGSTPKKGGRVKRNTGKDTAAKIDASDTYPVTIIVITVTAKQNGNAVGNNAINIPPSVPTPLPPLNFPKIVYICPNTAATPQQICSSQRSGMICLSKIKGAKTAGGNQPFNTSTITTIKAGLNPRIRKTFVPPALPLPCSRISIPFIILPAIILVGVDPSI